MELNIYGSRDVSADLENRSIPGTWICRLCSNRCAGDTRQWGLFQEVELAQKLMAFAAVQIQENDGLPTIICTNCRNLVFVAYDFKCQVEKSDHDLRQSLLIRQSTAQWSTVPINKSCENISAVEAIVPCLQKTIDNCMTFQDHSVNNHEQFIFELTNSCNIESESSKAENQLQSHHLVETSSIPENSSVSFEMSNTTSENESNGANPVITFESQYEIKNETKIDKDSIKKLELENFQKVCNGSDDEKPLVLRTKRHKCNSCIKSFSTLSLLEKHAVIHKRFELLYICFLCDAQFSTVDNVKNHAMEIHNMHMDREKILQNTKMRRITGWIKKIDDANDKESNSSAKNIKQNKTSKFICKFCCRQFSYQKSFVAHIKTHPDYNDKMLNELNRGPVIEAISDPDMIKDISESPNMNIVSQVKHTEVSSHVENMETTSQPENTNANHQSTNQKSLVSQNSINTEAISNMNNIDQSEDDDDYPDDDNDQDKEDVLSANIQCNQCGKLVATQRNLKRHLLTHSGLKYKCSVCNKDFSRPDKLREHQQLKHKEEFFGKSDSENESSDDSSQELNRKKDKNNRPYKCSLCPKAFAQQQSLANHEERHTRVRDVQKRYLCEVCSKCFAQSGSLVAHMRTHTGVKPYVCNECDRAFTKSTYLQLHLRTHSGEKPYICQYCSRAFARANTLARHITMHTGEAKYQCQICTKSFRRLTSLNEHTYTHTGQRPYACKICSKRYNNAGSLYAHTKKCKASQDTLVVKNYPVSLHLDDNSSAVSQSDNNKSPSQLLIFTEMKKDETITDETIISEPSTCQFLITDIHSEKPMSNNMLEPFGIQEPDVYNMNEKQFKTPYYELYPSM